MAEHLGLSRRPPAILKPKGVIDRAAGIDGCRLGYLGTCGTGIISIMTPTTPYAVPEPVKSNSAPVNARTGLSRFRKSNSALIG